MQTTQKKRPIWFILISVVLIGLGLMIRLYDLSDAPLDFHSTRQLHSALMARGIYYQLTGEQSWQAERAIEQWKLEGLIEPPIMEWLAGSGYWLMDEVDLQIPRLFALIFWLLAAIPLILLTKRKFGYLAALIAAAFFLFYPYGIIASRSFQPETLLVLFLALFFMALIQWNDHRSWKWAIWVGLFGGIAILVKTVAAFFIAGMWLGWLLSSQNWKSLCKEKKLWVAFLLTVLPYALYLIYGLWINKGLGGQFSLRFFPSMWTDIAFYLRWLSNLRRVVSVEWLLWGLMGTLLIEEKTVRNISLGAWVGYILLGFTLPHHISTHDYYHLPLLLFLSIGVAGMFHFLFEKIEGQARIVKVLVFIVLAFVFGIYAMDARSEMKKVNYLEEIAFWEELGTRFTQKDRVVALSEDYGNRLAYWGWITPRNWPSLDDIALRQAAGQEISLTDYFEDYTAGYDYFLVTDFEEYDRQPQLQEWLASNYPLIFSTEDYLIFDLEPDN